MKRFAWVPILFCFLGVLAYLTICGLISSANAATYKTVSEIPNYKLKEAVYWRGFDQEHSLEIELRMAFTLRLYATNKGNSPVELYNPSDKYFYKWKSKIYQFKYSRDGNSSVVVLNPGESVCLTYLMENNFDEYVTFLDKFNKGEIDGIYVELRYGAIRLDLKPTREYIELTENL